MTDTPKFHDRRADHPIDARFVERWSSRAMSGEGLPDATLMTVLEAARWAPSSSNKQPWRFVVARRSDAAFEPVLASLMEGNRLWCVRAGAFVAITSRTQDDNGKPISTHTFDAGAAWMSIALQAAASGVICHAMAGVDYPAARAALRIPEDHALHCVVALGLPGDVAALPDFLQERESPNARKPLAELVVLGGYPG